MFLSLAYLGKHRNQQVNSWRRKATGQGKDYQVKILNFQASKHFILMWELSVEALSMHKHNVIDEVPHSRDTKPPRMLIL